MVGVDAPSSSTSISVGVDTEVGVLGRVEPRGSEGVLGGVDFLILLCGRKNECADIFGFELGAIVRARRYVKVIALCLIRQFCRVNQVEPSNGKRLLYLVEQEPLLWLVVT
ncbi:hypothetical protein HZ326_31070 [Fusarium oxysporum f. sp. albedinis]|nr:hypothetical protein HZ326_31070 [Fusarium oxysporum f. sp. albedinis]